MCIFKKKKEKVESRNRKEGPLREIFKSLFADADVPFSNCSDNYLYLKGREESEKQFFNATISNPIFNVPSHSLQTCIQQHKGNESLWIMLWVYFETKLVLLSIELILSTVCYSLGGRKPPGHVIQLGSSA